MSKLPWSLLQVMALTSSIVLLLITRLGWLTQSPPSLYWEEVALGYDAYSISQTGRDHHGNPWPLVAFESFGDWKPSLYVYAAVPFIKLLGLSELSVRIPAALSGIAIAIAIATITYLLTKKELGSNVSRWLAIASLLLVAVNPWAIQFSRAAWEINLATALITWGVAVWIQVVTQSGKRVAWRQQVGLGVLSAVLFGLALYAQHSARVVVPLLVVWLTIWTIVIQIRSAKAWLAQLRMVVSRFMPFLITIAVGLVIMVTPIALSFSSPVVQQRFNETSIFTDGSAVQLSNDMRAARNYSLVSRALYHRYVLYAQLVLEQFLSHFDPAYLFVRGDANPRHSSQLFGLFYPLDSILILTGFFFLVSKYRKWALLHIGWIVVATLPAAISTGAPHALRTLIALPAWILVLTFGVIFLWRVTSSLRSIVVARTLQISFVVLYLTQFLVFFQYFLFSYPKLYSEVWQFGYSEMISAISTLHTQHPELPIYITREQGRPAMYYWFYTQVEPKLVQAENDRVPKDQGEFLAWQSVSFIDRSDQIAADQYILASSENFVLPNNVLQSGQQKPLLLSDQLGRVVWTIRVHSLEGEL